MMRLASALSHRSCGGSVLRFTSSVAVPWRQKVAGSTFSDKYPTEHRPSAIDGAGLGWWAKSDIPAGVRLRRNALDDDTLMKFESKDKLRATGWDVNDACNYGIGHWKDPQSIYFLKPGTSINHADPTREASVEYKHVDGAYEIWSVREIKAGEEMLCDYEKDYAPCEWYDEMQNEMGNTPLSQLPKKIEDMYSE